MVIFCKRILSGVDSEFNPLNRTNGLIEYRQEPVSKSAYQKQMDDEENGLDADQPETNLSIGDIRYWSDFSRVYYLPRSLQKLPDPPEWEDTALNWNAGNELFRRFDEVAQRYL